MHQYPQQVRIVEVAPRDGLQSQKQRLSLQQKLHWINGLSDCGYQAIEVGSLVNSKHVPQMQQTDELFQALNKHPACDYFVLVGSLKYLQQAIDMGVSHVSLMAAASNTFSEKNTHKSLTDSLQQLRQMLDLAKQQRLFTRVYLSCSFDCPYEGLMSAQTVADILLQINDQGCDEISLADTTGRANPLQVERLLEQALARIPANTLAVHFHDSYAQALANVLLSLQMGVSSIDTALGGLGGCPFAPGAKGNLATDELLFMLDGMGIASGLDQSSLKPMQAYVFDALDQNEP